MELAVPMLKKKKNTIESIIRTASSTLFGPLNHNRLSGDGPIIVLTHLTRSMGNRPINPVTGSGRVRFEPDLGSGLPKPPSDRLDLLLVTWNIQSTRNVFWLLENYFSYNTMINSNTT